MRSLLKFSRDETWLRTVEHYAEHGPNLLMRQACQELGAALDELYEVRDINRRFEADRRNLRSCIAGLIDGMHPDTGGDTHINGDTVRFLRSMFGIVE